MDNLGTFIKRSNQKNGGKLFGFGTSPAADWKVILFSTTALALLVTAVNVFIFVMIDKGEIFAVKDPTPQSQESLDALELKKTVEYYRHKAVMFENLEQVSSTTDPSI